MEYWYSIAILCYLDIKDLMLLLRYQKQDENIFSCHLTFSGGRKNKKAEFSLKTNFNFQILSQHIIVYMASIVFHVHNKPKMPFLDADFKGT